MCALGLLNGFLVVVQPVVGFFLGKHRGRTECQQARNGGLEHRQDASSHIHYGKRDG